MTNLTLLKHSVDKTERENSVSHPLKPTEMAGRKKRAPIAAESEEEPSRISGKTTQPAPDQKIRKRKRGEEKSQRVFKFNPKIRIVKKSDKIARDKLTA